MMSSYSSNYSIIKMCEHVWWFNCYILIYFSYKCIFSIICLIIFCQQVAAKLIFIVFSNLKKYESGVLLVDTISHKSHFSKY